MVLLDAASCYWTHWVFWDVVSIFFTYVHLENILTNADDALTGFFFLLRQSEHNESHVNHNTIIFILYSSDSLQVISHRSHD